jgi:hypothetical protein
VDSQGEAPVWKPRRLALDVNAVPAWQHRHGQGNRALQIGSSSWFLHKPLDHLPALRARHERRSVHVRDQRRQQNAATGQVSQQGTATFSWVAS